jgi:hypothetical protein
MKSRVRVAREQWVGNRPLPITYLGQVPNLSDEREIREMILRLRAVSEYFRRNFGIPLGATVIDTLAAAFDLDDENDNSEASRIIRALKRVGQQVGSLMIPVHHYGKGIETGLRGASGWRAGCDVVLSVLADRNQITGEVKDTELALAKSRFDQEGPISPFALQFKALGTRPTGKEWGSLFVEPLLDRAPRLGGTPKMVTEPMGVSCVRNAFMAAASAGRGVVITVRAGATVSAVRIADVRLEFNKRYPTDEEDKEKRADALRKAFKRALVKSIGHKFATEAIDGVEYVWPLPGAGMFVYVRKPKTGEDGADSPAGHPDNKDEPEEGGEGQA